MDYVYHKDENGNIVGSYPLKNIHFENEKMVGGGKDHLGIPIGLAIIQVSYTDSEKPYLVEDSDDAVDNGRFDEFFEKIAKIHGSNRSKSSKKTRKNHKK